MKLSDFFKKADTKEIVINSDIDGFLSGMILQKYYGCEIVGFSNSEESIWLKPEIESIYKPVYVDIFVNEPSTYCIDQHVVAYDEGHLKRIVAYGTKMNPNLSISEKTYMGDYYHKYPFGTVHYLIALMKQDGYDVLFNDLTVEQSVKGVDGNEYRICPAQIILRADDALYSSLGKYEKNAAVWWEQLKTYNSKTIDSLYEYLTTTCDKGKNDTYKRYIESFFRRGLECDGSDGAFRTITCADGKTLKSKILRYNEKISKIVGIEEMVLPKEVIEYRGSIKREAFSEDNLDKAITYAFIYGPTKANSFSYTMDIKKK